MLFVFHHR